MKLYKDGTGWKQPNKKTGAGWTYYENYKVKPPAADAIRALQIGLDKGKDLYKSVRDMPITSTLINGLNEAVRYHSEARKLRGEITKAGLEKVKEGYQMMGDQLLDNAEAIITETSQIPDRWSYHPNCLETFGELCTHYEYNKRMQQRFRESTTDGWSTYIQGSGGID